MPLISREIVLTIFKASRGHFFEANGANSVNRLIENQDFSIVTTITLDFATIEAVSTSFAGRLKEHVAAWKEKNPSLKVKVINAKRPIVEVLR